MCKKSNLKALSLVLAVMLFILPLAACKSEPADNNDTLQTTTETAANDNSENQTTEEIPDGPPRLENPGFEGETVTFLMRSVVAMADWYNREIYAEGQNAEPINDAVYLRNSEIEANYGISVNPVFSDDLTTAARNSIMSGDLSYDVLAPNLSATGALSAGGTLMNLNTGDNYLDLSGEWWDRRFVDEMTINDRLFYLTGDISVGAAEATWIVMFNKELHKTLGLQEDFYELVKTGKWTLDKFNEIIKDTYQDLNNNEKADAEDFFGLVTHHLSITSFFAGAGQSIAGKTADGQTELVVNSPDASEVMDRIALLMKGDPNSYAVSVGDNPIILDIFQNDRSLFYAEVLQCVIRLRRMETNFGILPYPKLNEDQEKYHNYVGGQSTVYSIPYNNPAPEKATFMLEALCRGSTNTLKPALIETTLQGKQLRDNESFEMLELILESRKYDMSVIFNWGALHENYLTMTSAGRSNFTSLYDSRSAKALDDIAKYIALYED